MKGTRSEGAGYKSRKHWKATSSITMSKVRVLRSRWPEQGQTNNYTPYYIISGIRRMNWHVQEHDTETTVDN